MAKIRTTLTIDDKVWKAVRIHAARAGKRESEFIEAALRRELGFDLLERIWARSDMDEGDAMDLALEVQAKADRASLEVARLTVAAAAEYTPERSGG